MFGKMTWGVLWILLLVQVHSASALISWDRGGTDDLWSTAANWNPNTVPSRTDAASIDQPENTHCVIQAGIAAECETLRVGNGGLTTNLDITGGSLSAAGAYIGVDSPAGHGILNISGGRFSTGSLQIGWGGIGTLNMTGGVIELTRQPRDPRRDRQRLGEPARRHDQRVRFADDQRLGLAGCHGRHVDPRRR